jgi:cytochrome c553
MKKISVSIILAGLMTSVIAQTTPATEQVRQDKADSITVLPVAVRDIVGEYPIIYVTREQYRIDHHNTATMFQKGEINEESFRGGSSLRVWNPKDGSVKILLEVPEGIARDPCLSFDATKLLVAIRRNIDDDYHIYELQLDQLLKQKQPLQVLPAQPGNNDYSSLRQLTFLSGVSDIDPLYLPSGEIVFSSTREPKYCMCNRHIMCNLYKMNGDGSNIRQIGKSTLFEGHASLMPDGRIIYDRWEYVDRNFGDAQGLWVTTADGFNHAIFWGNNTASPGGVIDAKIISGSSSVFVATFTSCHDRPWGAIALIDRQKGIDGRQAVLQTWPATAIDLVDDGKEESFTEARKYDAFTGVKPKLEDPFPLNGDWFLASGMTGEGEKTGIYLLGRDSTMKIIYTDKNIPPSHGCFDPTPLKPVTPPPVSIQKADYTKSTGNFYVTNVYEGLGMDNVEKGSVKFLRVVESPEKQTWSSKGWHNNHGEQGPGMNWYEFTNKRVLGTVPVEEDGSVNFTVPADTFLYFQLLDEQGRMIQTMRSGIIIRPGEINGCVGCHEDRLSSVPLLSKTPKALTKPPRQLKNRYGASRLFSYVKEVQEPVFDKYCIQCHDYGKVEQNPKKPNLAGDLNTIFNTSYVELYKKELIKPVGAGPHVKLKPYTWGSTQSRIAEVLLNGHPDPEIDAKRKELGVFVDWQTNPEAAERVFTWIDLNAPYYPVYLTSFPDNRFGRCPLTDEQLTRLAAICGYENVFRSRNSDAQVALDWAISFTRPEMSPCLAKLSKNSAEYKEALAIIATGKNAIETTPRGENPNDICVPQRDAKQQAKYDFLLDVEHRMRKAIVNNEKLFDKDM